MDQRPAGKLTPVSRPESTSLRLAYVEPGSVGVDAPPAALRDLASEIRRDPVREVIRPLGGPDGSQWSLVVRPTDALFRVSVEPQLLVIEGDPQHIEDQFAHVLDMVADMAEDATEPHSRIARHVHVEYWPGHPSITSDSLALVVSEGHPEPTPDDDG
jgi:hypothetical protein